jgi:hypothetical protein
MKEQILNDIAEKVMVNLAKHNVELSLIDELTTLVNKSREVSGNMVDNYLQAKKYAEISVNAAKLHLKNLESVSKLVNTIKQQGDSLGLDVTKVKEWRLGSDFLNGNPKGATEVMIKKLESIK